MPVSKRAGEDGDRVGRTGEWHGAGGSWTKQVGIGAPLDFKNLRARCVGRKDRGLGRDDQIRTPADSFAPPSHRLENEGTIQKTFARARIVDDWRVDLEHGGCADVICRGNSFAGEIVVALDHDIRTKRPRQPA